MKKKRGDRRTGSRAGRQHRAKPVNFAAFLAVGLTWLVLDFPSTW